MWFLQSDKHSFSNFQAQNQKTHTVVIWWLTVFWDHYQSFNKLGGNSILWTEVAILSNIFRNYMDSLFIRRSCCNVAYNWSDGITLAWTSSDEDAITMFVGRKHSIFSVLYGRKTTIRWWMRKPAHSVLLVGKQRLDWGLGGGLECQFGCRADILLHSL